LLFIWSKGNQQCFSNVKITKTKPCQQ